MKTNHPGNIHFRKLMKPFRERIANERGFITKVADEMTRLSRATFKTKAEKAEAKVFSRQEVGTWFSENEDHRTEPSFGTGLLLLEAIKNLDNQTNNQTKL